MVNIYCSELLFDCYYLKLYNPKFVEELDVQIEKCQLEQHWGREQQSYQTIPVIN